LATLGWLKIGVTADTSQFKKGLSQSAQMLQSFKSQMLGIAGTLGVAFGARELIGWVHGAMDAVTESRTLAERVGMTAEAFGKLQYAARLSHVDGETLTHSLEKMNEKLGDVAINGSGPAYEALRRFGLSAQQLTRMGTEQTFFTLVDVIGKIENPMERASVAMDFFGKSGQAVINMAAQGSAQLKAMGEEGMRLGAAMSDIDAAKVVEADTAMIRIGESIQGVANQIAVELAPFVTAIADQFVAWMQSSTKAGDRMAQAIDWVTSAMGGLADVVQVVQVGFHYFQAAFAQAISYILAGVDKAIQAFGWLYEKVTGVKLEVTNLAKELSDAFEQAAVGELHAAETAWNKKWGHERVREFVDDLKMAAAERATFAAGKAQAFAGAGRPVEHPKVVDLQFAGATEMGSKEAYSAILKSRAMQTTNLQNRIEANTRSTAEASGRTADATARMAQFFDQIGRAGGELGRAMTAGN
jgi:hypothetical protein